VEFNQNEDEDFNTITVNVDKAFSYTLNTTIKASSGKNIISINNITIDKIDETITNNTIPNNSVIILDEVT